MLRKTGGTPPEETWEDLGITLRDAERVRAFNPRIMPQSVKRGCEQLQIELSQRGFDEIKIDCKEFLGILCDHEMINKIRRAQGNMPYPPTSIALMRYQIALLRDEKGLDPGAPVPHDILDARIGAYLKVAEQRQRRRGNDMFPNFNPADTAGLANDLKPQAIVVPPMEVTWASLEIPTELVQRCEFYLMKAREKDGSVPEIILPLQVRQEVSRIHAYLEGQGYEFDCPAELVMQAIIWRLAWFCEKGAWASLPGLVLQRKVQELILQAYSLTPRDEGYQRYVDPILRNLRASKEGGTS